MAARGNLALTSRDDEILVETYTERLIGLTEMFPAPVRNAACNAASASKSASIWLFGSARTVSFAVASLGVLALLPYNLEFGRQELLQAQEAQERSILLGPNAGMTGQNMTSSIPMPQIATPSS